MTGRKLEDKERAIPQMARDMEVLIGQLISEHYTQEQLAICITEEYYKKLLWYAGKNLGRNKTDKYDLSYVTDIKSWYGLPLYISNWNGVMVVIPKEKEPEVVFPDMHKTAGLKEIKERNESGKAEALKSLGFKKILPLLKDEKPEPKDVDEFLKQELDEKTNF